MLGIPHLVIYRLSTLSFWIAQRIINVRYISLANILLDTLGEKASSFRSLELLQREVSADNISREVLRLMDDPVYRDDCLRQYSLVRNLFIDKHATVAVARYISKIADHPLQQGGVD
jgi:lipid-A-disaccharide synthase